MAELQFIDVWQTLPQYNEPHKSSIAYGGNRESKAYAVGVILHGATITFDRKDVPKIIELLQMENSPLVKD